MNKNSYVYILANKKHGTLYVGVTNDLLRRISEHKSKKIEGFTMKYNVDKLVYYEVYDDMYNATEEEVLPYFQQTENFLARMESLITLI